LFTFFSIGSVTDIFALLVCVGASRRPVNMCLGFTVAFLGVEVILEPTALLTF
jgi:hypothetical protein